MTQADILGKNQDPFLESSSTNRRINKPTGFDEQFAEASIPNLSEQSPIRPSKYFATDRFVNENISKLNLESFLLNKTQPLIKAR